MWVLSWKGSHLCGSFLLYCKYSLNVILTTLVDITETKARRGDDKFKLNQQANYMTMIQTAGLRINPNPISLEKKLGNIKEFKFGSAFKDEQRYWIFKFDDQILWGATAHMTRNLLNLNLG